MTSITAAINRVAAGPVYRPRMIARGITIIAAPPSPCTNRPASSHSNDGANVQITNFTTNIAIAAHSGGFLPERSAQGP